MTSNLTLKHNIAELVNPREVTIRNLNYSTHKVTIDRKDRDVAGNPALLIDGVKEGYFDPTGYILPSDLPMELQRLKIELSSGATVSIWERNLRAIVDRKRGSRGWMLTVDHACSMEEKVRVGGSHVTFSWGKSSSLQMGTVLGIEYPFQWLNGWLTNGTVSFPTKRPEGAEWRKYPIPAVAPECWELFLSILHGCFLNDLIPWFNYMIETHKEDKQKAATIALTSRQSDLKRIVGKFMWKPEQQGKQVHVGKNVVFCIDRHDKSPIYLMDNPNVGAIYVFDDRQEALKLAMGEISRTQALQVGIKRIVHRAGWEDRVSELINS